MFFQNAYRCIKTLAGDFFQADGYKNRRWISWLFLAGLYLLGVMLFSYFFVWGKHTLEYADWADITGPRFQFLTTAMRSWQLPLHISDPSTLHGWTLRYMVVSDAFVSPQLVLLRWLTIQQFNLFNVILLYTLGFAGLLVLRSRLRLSLFSYTTLFFLFNFNGHLLAHYSEGHATWGGYFLFPWFVWLVLRLVDGERTWNWTFQMAFLLLVIWLQGSFHQFVWLLIFLGLVAVFVPRSFWYVIRAGVFCALASAFRILPSILLFGQYKDRYFNGYPTVSALWDSLVRVTERFSDGTSPYFVTGVGRQMGPWETTVFIGLLGGLFLVFFGIYRGLIDRQGPYRVLLLPLSVIVFFSIGPMMDWLRELPIPIIQGERVGSRIFSVALVFGLVLATERLQRSLENHSTQPALLGASLVCLGMTMVDLWQDLNIWRIANIPHIQWKYFDVGKSYVENKWDDTIYLALVFGGLALSVLTLVVLGVLSMRERRKQPKATTASSN